MKSDSSRIKCTKENHSNTMQSQVSGAIKNQHEIEITMKVTP